MMNKYKVLIIDNDPEALNVINKILLGADVSYEIFNANSAIKGLDIILKEKPDLIITDWDMPEVSGIELIRIMQNDRQTQGIPIIICTGVMLDEKYMLTALELGAIDFLRKPVSGAELLARISTMLRLIDTLKQLAHEREERLLFEKQALEEKLQFQNVEIKSKAITLGKFNSLLKNISSELLTINKTIKTENENITLTPLVQRIRTSIRVDNWHNFIQSYERINPKFFEKLVERFPNLTKNEIKLCALLKLRLSTKQISAITLQTVRSIEMARFRLRKKIDIVDEDYAKFFNF